MDLILPYKIGDLAESKSSVAGYRGAWFRCRIHDMRVDDIGYLEYCLEYIDYEEEEKEWVRVFQKNPASSKQNSRETTEIMIRPSFPSWYYGHELPEQLPVSDVTAVVDETWKVGDMVDWRQKDCYWSGTITKLLNKYMVKVQLPAPPIGEGKCYTANRKHLRPTLEWSLAKGWTVPLSQAKGKSWHAARLLRHRKSESDESTSGDDENEDMQQSVSGASNIPQEAQSPVIPTSPSAANSASNQSAQKDTTVTSTEKLNPSPTTSKSPNPRHSAKVAAASSQPASSGISVRQEPDVGIAMEQEQGSSMSEGEVDDGTDECLAKLKTLEARLKGMVESTCLDRKRRDDLLRGPSKDASME